MPARLRPWCRTGAPLLSAVFGLLAVVRPVSGQAAAWTTNGPVGGSVYCLVFDPSRPSTLYAGTDKGVFKSGDGGATWAAANSGLSARVQTIAIDPASTSTLYAGTVTPDGVESVGIFKSTDGGASWAAANEGLVDTTLGISPVDIEVLAFDPRHPGTLWAGTRFSDIFESTDGGTTWQNKTFGGYNLALEVSAFRFDPSNSSTILAASSAGLLRSTDGGENWDTYGNAGESFFSLVPDPISPATLYAGNTAGSGIFKSTDAGAHWTSINKNLTVNQGSGGTFLPLVVALTVDPSRPSTLYAGTYGNGLFQSTDAGATWASVNAGMRSSYVWTVAPAPGQSSTVFAGTVGAGVYESVDAARTWSPTNSGLSLGLVSALVADSAAPHALYAAAFDGVYKSLDGGGSWQPSNNGLPVAPVTALVQQPGSRALFAGTRGAGLLKSTDAGATWSGSAQGLADSYVASIAIDPSNASILYAGTAHPDTSQSERVYKSTNGGSTWTQTSLDARTFSITSISVNPAKPSQIVAVSRGALGYFQSLDAGQTWSTVTTDANCGGVNSVLFDSSGATTYLAGGIGACRSTDGGKTWLLANVGNFASVRTFLIDPSNAATLYAGAEPTTAASAGGVYRSTDGGQTWEAVGSGLSSDSVTSLATDPARGVLHAGILGGGVAELVFPQKRSSVQPLPSTGHGTRRILPR